MYFHSNTQLLENNMTQYFELIHPAHTYKQAFSYCNRMEYLYRIFPHLVTFVKIHG